MIFSSGGCENKVKYQILLSWSSGCYVPGVTEWVGHLKKSNIQFFAFLEYETHLIKVLVRLCSIQYKQIKKMLWAPKINQCAVFGQSFDAQNIALLTYTKPIHQHSSSWDLLHYFDGEPVHICVLWNWIVDKLFVFTKYTRKWVFHRFW